MEEACQLPNPYHDPNNGQFTTKSGTGAKAAAADKLRQYRRQVSHAVSAKAFRAVRDNGGITINLKGNEPKDGYAFAPSKDTEKIIPKRKLRMRDIDDYIDQHYDQISAKGGHLGMWEQDGNVYLDVSHVGPANEATIAKAQDAQQLAVFDLKTFQEVHVGTITNGRYRRLGKASDIHDKHRGKDQGAGQKRGA